MTDLTQVRIAKTKAKSNRYNRCAQARKSRHNNESELNAISHARTVKRLNKQINDLRTELTQQKRIITRLKNNKKVTVQAHDLNLHNAIQVINQTIDRFVNILNYFVIMI